MIFDSNDCLNDVIPDFGNECNDSAPEYCQCGQCKNYIKWAHSDKKDQFESNTLYNMLVVRKKKIKEYMIKCLQYGVLTAHRNYFEVLGKNTKFKFSKPPKMLRKLFRLENYGTHEINYTDHAFFLWSSYDYKSSKYAYICQLTDVYLNVIKTEFEKFKNELEEKNKENENKEEK